MSSVIVVGAGAMGLAAAWRLASAGVSVRVFEQYEIGTLHGASHGSTRNYNNAYAEPHFIELLGRARPLWHDLETASGEKLLELHGLATHGADPAVLDEIFERLQADTVPVEMMDPSDANARWQGMRFDGPVITSPDAGIVYAAKALEVMHRLAEARGAEFTSGATVQDITVTEDGRANVTVEVESETERHTADRVVVAAGAWSNRLLAGLVPVPNFEIIQAQPAHFEVTDPHAVWPSFNQFLPPLDGDPRSGNVYGMPSPGEGVKVGFHRAGKRITPETRDYLPDTELLAKLQTHVDEWFPGLDSASFDLISCTYTATSSGIFVLDQLGPITVGAGFSGHGFKFVPAVGDELARLSLGGAPDPRFAFHADAQEKS